DPTDKYFDSLAVGQTADLTIPVTVTDKIGATSITNIVVHITGTNDDPVIGTVKATTVAEGSVAFTGQLTSTDVDSGDTATYTTTSTQPGFSLNSDGSYTVDPTDKSFDSLAVVLRLNLVVPMLNLIVPGSLTITGKEKSRQKQDLQPAA
ncbi:MAG: hypothetical protein DRP52_05305, partial [Planctomycetota bacterium]